MIHYPKLIQIILNLAEIEALPKCIRSKSSEIQNLFSAKIPALVKIVGPIYWPYSSKVSFFPSPTILENFVMWICFEGSF